MSRVRVAVVLVLAIAVGAAGDAMLDGRTETDRSPSEAASKTADAKGPPGACWQRTRDSSPHAERGGTLRCFNLPARLRSAATCWPSSQARAPADPAYGLRGHV